MWLQQKHVQEDLAAVAIKQARTHRQVRASQSEARRELMLFPLQYMNRKGGFNR